VTPQTRESLSTLDDSKRKNAQQHSNAVISGDSQINNVSLNQSSGLGFGVPSLKETKNSLLLDGGSSLTSDWFNDTLFI
jgi:hypothetical protein